MGTICGCILVALVGVGGDPGDSLGPVRGVTLHGIATELVEQTEPSHSKSTSSETDNIASLLMAPGAVHAIWVDSDLDGDPFWPGAPAPPVGGRTFSWLFAGAIGVAFVTFAIIAATASSGD